MIKFDDLKVGVDIGYECDTYRVKYVGTNFLICDCTTKDGVTEESILKKADVLLHGSKMKKKTTYYLILYRSVSSTYTSTLIFKTPEERRDYKAPHGYKLLKYFEVEVEED